jgi:hypothetical protein
LKGELGAGDSAIKNSVGKKTVRPEFEPMTSDPEKKFTSSPFRHEIGAESRLGTLRNARSGLVRRRELL